MATIFNKESVDWNFRVEEKRIIKIKTVNQQMRKVAAVDVKTNLPIAIEVPLHIPLKNLQREKEYNVNLKVYTSKKLQDVDKEFLNLFEIVDLDQSFDDFIKVYWFYPSKISFKIETIEPAE